MSSMLKNGNLLEWCTVLPTLNCPSKSSVLRLKGQECYFQLDLEKNVNDNIWYYVLWVELEEGDSEWKPCDGKVKIGFKKVTNLSLGENTFTVSEYGRTVIWFIQKKIFESKLPADYLDGNWLKFEFHFKDAIELKFLLKRDEKSVQTPSYADTSFLLNSVSKTFSKLLDEDPHHDIQFKCGGETIPAHKNVLCCSSDVFANMLQSEMLEGKTGEVNIKDMDPILFRQFLRFLYTGALPELTVDTAIEFYEASDKYAIDALKKLCADFLTENLSLENACNILILADRHNDEDLKKSSMTYIFNEKIPIVGEKWNDFCNENQKLAIEYFNLFYQHLYKE